MPPSAFPPDRLRPALRCGSMILLLLGGFLAVMVGLVIWLRTPDALYIHRFTAGPAAIRGGESLTPVLESLRREVCMAVALLGSGSAGLLIGHVRSLEGR